MKLTAEQLLHVIFNYCYALSYPPGRLNLSIPQARETFECFALETLHPEMTAPSSPTAHRAAHAAPSESDAARARTLLRRTFTCLLRVIKFLPLNDSAELGVQVLNADVAKFLDETVPKSLEDGKHHDLPPDDPEPDYKARYHSLIMAVGRHYAGEDRFDTALRYIREREGRADALRLVRKEDGLWLRARYGDRFAAVALNYRADGIVHDVLSKLCEVEEKRDAPVQVKPL